MTDSKAERQTPEMEVEARFCAAVQRLREWKGWSQGEVARRMNALGWDGFHQTTISRIEKGSRPVRLGEAEALAAVFDSTVSAMAAPEDTEVLMRELQAGLDLLADAERQIRSGAFQYHVTRSMLFETISGASQVSPEAWVDPDMRNQFQKLVDMVKGRTENDISGLLREVADTTEKKGKRQS